MAVSKDLTRLERLMLIHDLLTDLICEGVKLFDSLKEVNEKIAEEKSK